jgi:hypothetical protein
MEGGALIGKGRKGCVFRPALPCLESGRKEDMVSKLVVKSEYDLEIEIKSIMEKIDPDSDFSLYVKDSCTLDKSKLLKSDEYDKCVGFLTFGKNHLLSLDDGGESLFDILTKREREHSKPFVQDLLIGFSRVLYGLSQINKAEYTHADIKLDNLTYDIHKKRMMIIDFGKLQKIDNLKLISSFRVSPESYIIFKYFNFNYNIRKLVSLDLDNKKNQEYLKGICTKIISRIKHGIFFGLFPGHEKDWSNSFYYMSKEMIQFFEKNDFYNDQLMADSLIEILKVCQSMPSELQESSFYFLIYKNLDCWTLGMTMLQTFLKLQPFIDSDFYNDVLTLLFPKMLTHFFYRIDISDAFKTYNNLLKKHFKNKIKLYKKKFYIPKN